MSHDIGSRFWDPPHPYLPISGGKSSKLSETRKLASRMPAVCLVCCAAEHYSHAVQSTWTGKLAAAAAPGSIHRPVPCEPCYSQFLSVGQVMFFRTSLPE